MNINTYAEDLIDASSLAPAADAAGRTGTYITVRNAVAVFLIYHINQGNAATIALTPQQAQDVSGTNAKAIPTSYIWANQDMATTTNLTRQTDAASFTTSAAVKVKLVIFKVQLASLDIAGGFVSIALQTGASNAANITSGRVVLVPRYFGHSQSAWNAMVN